MRRIPFSEHKNVFQIKRIKPPPHRLVVSKEHCFEITLSEEYTEGSKTWGGR